MSRVQKLKSQLAKIGITRAVAEPVMYDGSQMVTIRWNGDEEHFGGYDFRNKSEMEQYLARFKDENLS